MAELAPAVGACARLQPDREGALVEAARSDPNAFAELYTLYQAPIFRYLRARTENEDEAMDLMQQTFLRAFECLPTYRDRGLPFSAWLFRIARNIAIDWYRRARPLSSWDHAPDSLLRATEEGPEAAAISEESLGRLQQAAAELTTDQRELLALRFGSELTMREIGQVVGRSEDAVRKKLVRILADLRRHYGT